MIYPYIYNPSSQSVQSEARCPPLIGCLVIGRSRLPAGVQVPPGLLCGAADPRVLQEDEGEDPVGGQEALCPVVHEQRLLKASGEDRVFPCRFVVVAHDP